MTAVNFSIFYTLSKPDKHRALALAAAALVRVLPYVETLPAAQNYARTATQIFQHWSRRHKDIFKSQRLRIALKTA